MNVLRRLRDTSQSLFDETPFKVKGGAGSRGRLAMARYNPNDTGIGQQVTTEVPFGESQVRTKQGDRASARLRQGQTITPEEQRYIAESPQGYADYVMGSGPVTDVMTGQAAEEMAAARPFGRRMQLADQPEDLGLYAPARRAMAVQRGELEGIRSPVETTLDVYKLAREGRDIRDIPTGNTSVFAREAIDTRLPVDRAKAGAYGYDESPYQDLQARTIEDRSDVTGNLLDEYMGNRVSKELGYQDRIDLYDNIAQGAIARKIGFQPTPGLPFTDPAAAEMGRQTLITRGGRLPGLAATQPIAPAGSYSVLPDQAATGGLTLSPGRSSYRFVLPEDATYQGTPEAGLDLMIPRSVSNTTVGTVSGQQIAARLRRDNPEAYAALRGRLGPVANPAQVDFSIESNRLRQQTDALARLREQDLQHQAVMANPNVTTGFRVTDSNPDEFYLFGTQKDTAPGLPWEVANRSLDHSEVPSQSLVRFGLDSRPAEPIRINRGQVGLGVPIERNDLNPRAGVVQTQPSVDHMGLKRNPRIIPLDPISPADQALPGMFYAKKVGLRADVTPDVAIAEDRHLANFYEVAANREQAAVDHYLRGDRQLSPDMQRRADSAYNNMMMANAYGSSASNMQNAVDLADAATVPSDLVGVTRLGATGLPMNAPPLDERVMALTSRSGVLPGMWRPNVDAPPLPGIGQPQQVGGLSLSPGAAQPVMMPFEQAAAYMDAAKEASRSRPILQMPVVAPVAEPVSFTSSRLRNAQVPTNFGDPQSTSIVTADNGMLYKQLRQADPNLQPDEIRRGVQYVMEPVGDTGSDHVLKLTNSGAPVLDASGNRMIWDGRPIETYNPVLTGTDDVRLGVRPTPNRAVLKEQNLEQAEAALEEGYTPRGTGYGPADQIPIGGRSLQAMRQGLSADEMRQATAHNRLRQMQGLPEIEVSDLIRGQRRGEYSLSELGMDMVKNPTPGGGIMIFGDPRTVDLGRYSIPRSGVPITVMAPGTGMYNSAMGQIPKPR